MTDVHGTRRTGAATLDRLRSDQPPPLEQPGARLDVRAADAAVARHLVVLDDDPTGSQVVHGVPVLTAWDDDDLRWAFTQPSSCFFVLTNTRSLGAAATRQLLSGLAERIDRVAAELGTEAVLLSRSDSTLRGHFPLETDVLADVAAKRGHPYDAVLLVPAYPDAGRVTVDDVHYVRTGADYLPAGETQYATDEAFGYRSSDLCEWVREKTGDPDLDVRSVSLVDIRTGGVDHVAQLLGAARGGAVVVVNAIDESDLDVVALATVTAERTGWRALGRVGPGFVPARAGIERRAPLSSDEIFRSGGARGHGLVVVGSHVDLTTRQVAALRQLPGIGTVELDVTALFTPQGTRQELARCSAAVAEAARHGDVLLMTSRTLTVPRSGESSLDFARQVSAALVELTRQAVGSSDLAWVVAKGGITSHDVATDGLRIRRATVLGQLFDGIVSVWRNETADTDDALFGLPYVVFAGNVGDETSLRDAVTLLRGGRRA